MIELSKNEAIEKMELAYFESELGFHFAIDLTWLEQVGEFQMILPTGEIFDTNDFKE